MPENNKKSNLLNNDDGTNSLSPGNVIADKYKILSVLGSGGMGTVYLVQQIGLGKNFALKVLDVHKQSEVAVRRFHQEAKTAAALRHHNLVEVNDFGVFGDNQPYLVMDYVDGESLDKHLKTVKVLSVEYAVALAVQVGFGLMYAHLHGVVHRDIKPGNIIVLHPNKTPDEGTVKIVDFGIAKLMQSEDGQIQELTRTGEIFGSPIYMSPEQCRGTAVDGRSDIFSLGCVLYECLTGLPPFIGDSAMATMVKRLTEEPPSLKDGSLGIDFPPALEVVVRGMLATEPENRYQDFSEVIQDLMRIDDPDATLINPFATPKSKIPYLRESILVLATATICCLATFLVDKHYFVPALLEPPSTKPVDESHVELGLYRTKLETPRRELLSTSSGVREILHFPAEAGHITIGTSDEHPAFGDFPVPPGATVSLKLNEEAAAIDDFLKNLSDVKFASIAFSSPKVVVSNASMKMFANLKHLESLVISGGAVSTLYPIYHAPFLDSLDVTDTHVPLSELLKVDRLNNLYAFSFGPVKDPSPTLMELARNPVLDYLKYTGPVGVELKTNARGLSLEDVDELTKIPALSSLAIKNSPLFDDICLRNLLAHKKLKELEILDCGITAKSIPLLKKQKLSKLTLTTNDWSREGLTSLNNFPYKVEIRKPQYVAEHDLLKNKISDQSDLFINSIDSNLDTVSPKSKSQQSAGSTQERDDNER